MILHALVFALLFVALVQVFVAAYAFSRRKTSPVALSFAFLLFALAIYAAGYAGELSSASLSSMLSWSVVEYFGISFLPAMWILVSAQYVNYRWSSNKLVCAALLFVSCVTLFGALTDPFLHLKYASAWVNAKGPFPVLSFTRGPIYWMHVAYSFISFAFSTLVLLWNFITAPKFFRRQQFFILIGSVIPWGNYFFYLQGFPVAGIDTVPYSMFFAVACFGISIFWFRILDVVPVARGLVFESMSDGAIVLDMFGRLVDFNTSAAAVFPALNSAAFSRKLTDVLDAYPTFCANFAGVDGADFQFSVDDDGRRRFYQCKYSNIVSRGGVPVGKLLHFKDNTDSTLLLEKLQELATIDPLTRVFNRRHFLDLMARQISWHARTGRPISLIILDIDHFKIVNDSFGHLAGDEVLKTVAATIAAQLRSFDISARFGGEEFVCLLPQTAGEDAVSIAERIRVAIQSASVSFKDLQPISVSASFGVCCVSSVRGDESVDSIIGRADAALYGAKRSGRNAVVPYSPGMEEAGASGY